MTRVLSQAEQHPDYRPWFREPWVWLLIALPVTAIVGCAITIWLALSHPDYTVVDEYESQQVESGLRAGTEEESTGPAQNRPGQGNDDG
jgi:hypothetical protein